MKNPIKKMAKWLVKVEHYTKKKSVNNSESNFFLIST